MSRKDKLVEQFLVADHSFKWSQLIALLKILGFAQTEASGSRVNFTNGVLMIKLHKPHPGNEVKALLQREKLI